jgi:hypothetical protein
MIPVRIINTVGETALVEWMVGADFVRGYLPKGVIQANATISESDAEAATSYGVTWENYIRNSVSVKDIAREMRRHGLWTADDLRARPQEYMRIIQTLFALDVVAVFEGVK